MKDYEGTLVFVSHDRWFVGQLANRILEINPEGILDYKGTYEEYVHFCGDDHLDVDRVVLKAKKTKKLKKNITKTSSQKNVKEKDTDKKEKELWNQIDAIESRIREIDQIFAEPDYYERTDPQETTNLSKERTELDKKLEGLTFTWENMEKRKKIPG